MYACPQVSCCHFTCSLLCQLLLSVLWSLKKNGLQVSKNNFLRALFLIIFMVGGGWVGCYFRWISDASRAGPHITQWKDVSSALHGSPGRLPLIKDSLSGISIAQDDF